MYLYGLSWDAVRRFLLTIRLNPKYHETRGGQSEEGVSKQEKVLWLEIQELFYILKRI